MLGAGEAESQGSPGLQSLVPVEPSSQKGKERREVRSGAQGCGQVWDPDPSQGALTTHIAFEAVAREHRQGHGSERLRVKGPRGKGPAGSGRTAAVLFDTPLPTTKLPRDGR